MKRSLRDAWCAALRSGDYKQAVGSFIVGPNSRANPTDESEAFCCLGVLCKVAGVPVEDGANGGNWTFVVEAVGPLHQTLYAMNDGDNERYYQSPFDEIADFIEANIPIDDMEESPQ